MFRTLIFLAQIKQMKNMVRIEFPEENSKKRPQQQQELYMIEMYSISSL